MTICDDLRQSVLQAAIQGKLTQQLPEDGSAADLLASIKAEKENLIRDKKIKKEKPLAPISADEIPFDIPDNWEWCYLCDLGHFSSGKTPDMSNSLYWDGGTIPWITSKDMKNKYLKDSMVKITEAAKPDMVIYPSGTLLMVVRSGILKRMLPVCILATDSTINQDIKAFSLFGNTSTAYTYYMIKGLETNILQNYTKRVTTVDSLRFDEFSTQMPVPLPPLAEQHRIVARVNELMAKIDELETVEKELVALKKAFPGDMKASLLQSAMQGKLTQQLPEDGSAADLLASIGAEKEQLIKEKKIKKEKPLAPISEDEFPFDIPDNWACVKAGYIFSLWDGPKVNAVRLPNLDAKFLRGKTEANILTSGKFVHAGDKMILVDGENSGEVFTAPEDGIQGSTFKLLYISRSINTAYAQYFLLFYKDYLRNNKKGSAIPHLNKEMLANLAFPIPPLAEQKRIVEKLDKLLPLCDALKEDGVA